MAGANIESDRSRDAWGIFQGFLNTGFYQFQAFIQGSLDDRSHGMGLIRQARRLDMLDHLRDGWTDGFILRMSNGNDVKFDQSIRGFHVVSLFRWVQFGLMWFR